MGASPEETLQRLLSTYELAAKLRQLRLRKKIALVDLGRHNGLSASMLSQLETGKMIPTLPTLARIATVFDVSLDHFFDDRRRQRTFTLVRAAGRLRFHERAEADVREHLHEGSEFLFLVEGSMVIRFHDEDHQLHQGDSVYFDASERHSYRGTGESGTRAVVITMPPRR